MRLDKVVATGMQAAFRRQIMLDSMRIVLEAMEDHITSLARECQRLSTRLEIERERYTRLSDNLHSYSANHI